ncbi:kinase-like protein [Leptodontidium sp. MPI-SDFR-AT-0119]|nr:kinase-like protein [Leptodontidium sp. MPI-SDFR-AT-0119]
MPHPFQVLDSHDTSEDNHEFDYAKDPVGVLRWEDERGQVMEKRIEYSDELIVGREPVSWSTPGFGESILITIADDASYPFVSKRHFRIYSVVFDRSDPSVQPLIYCEDLESTNGTYVNGVCIGMIGRERVGHLLCHGDIIEVRPHWRFQLHQPSQYPTSEILGHPEEMEYFQDLYTVSNRKLGSGQYGAVFLATEVATSKQTACKIVNFGDGADRGSQISESLHHGTTHQELSPGGKAKLKREIFILSKLNHPHIVCMRKAFFSENTMYTFTDLAPGGDLCSYLDSNGALTDCHTRIISRQLVLAVKYLHSKGIVHRDIKLENILIMHTDLGGRVLLTDFGFAIDARPSGGRMLSKLGTPGYVAPEVEIVESSKVGYTSAADLWSLGVSIAYLLTNDTILPRDKISQVSQVQLAELFHGFGDGTKRKTWQNLSPRALRFLRGLLASDPADRMTAEEALEHSWLTKPLSEAALIEECCAKIVRFWKKRDSDEVVIGLPSTIQSKQDENSRRDSRSKRKLPDASSSPYFTLDRHLHRREASQRRTLLAGLSKTGSQFVAPADETKTYRLQMVSILGRDMFGRNPDTQVQERPSVEDEVSLVPKETPRPRSERVFGFDLSDPTGPSPGSSIEAEQVNADSETGIQNMSRKRARWESEDLEEKILRDDVAKNATKWQSAKALKDAVMKRKMEVEKVGGKPGEVGPGRPTLAIRASTMLV